MGTEALHLVQIENPIKITFIFYKEKMIFFLFIVWFKIIFFHVFQTIDVNLYFFIFGKKVSALKKLTPTLRDGLCEDQRP